MDSLSNKVLEDRALKKQLAVFLAGSGEAYEYYKRTQQISPHYPNDFHYYNDTFYIRHDRNIEEINKIKRLIREGILKPEMLLYNTWNTFYPSYIMNHHFTAYLQILNYLASHTQNKDVARTFEEAKKMQKLGCFCQKAISIQFGHPVNDYQPKVEKSGQIQMEEDIYFFDKHVSLYFNIACFFARWESQRVFVFVNLRNPAGNIDQKIKVKDFGERISSEYLQVGYNLNGAKPFLIIKTFEEMKVRLIHNMSFFTQFNLSILDLKKSLSLAIKYTKMRTQFKTLPNSKNQRAIITYQAVGSRIVDAFSKLVCLSELNKALLNNKHIISLAGPLIDIHHHLILESVIRLRQCCGGFGYLQVAGHAGCIQKLTLRASEALTAEIPQNPQILKRLHYYSSSEDMQQYFGDLLTNQNAFKHSQIFSVFVNLCVNMRKSSSRMRKQIYMRHFMYQSAIQILKTTEQFSKLDRDSVWFLVLYYSCACYILENSEFVNWKYVDQHFPREDYFKGLTEYKNNCLNKMISQIDLIEEILEVDRLRNVIVGRQNSHEFYEQVLNVSKKNLRNSQDFVQYVRKPIVDFLAENNPKL